jgi:hypothetical protein
MTVVVVCPSCGELLQIDQRLAPFTDRFVIGQVHVVAGAYSHGQLTAIRVTSCFVPRR